MPKYVLVVSDKDEFGERGPAGMWLSDTEDELGALAAAAAKRGMTMKLYKETFDPRVWSFELGGSTTLPQVRP